jgi:hypothetical protein
MLHRAQEKLFPMFKCLLFNIFRVFNLSERRSHTNTFNFGHSLDFQIQMKGVGGSISL